ncbi:MAG: hypothetical protein NC417_09080 [Candidatus Gastranaerophilales bacterium]|nr:hypothetical protein [Candidatus Gastranaerophilales bacterium]
MAIKFSDTTPTAGKFGTVGITQIKHLDGKIYRFVDATTKVNDWSIARIPDLGEGVLPDPYCFSATGSTTVFSGAATDVTVSGSLHVGGRVSNDPYGAITIVGTIGGKEFLRETVTTYHDADDSPEVVDKNITFSKNVGAVNDGTIVISFITTYDGAGPTLWHQLNNVSGSITYTN